MGSLLAGVGGGRQVRRGQCPFRYGISRAGIQTSFFPRESLPWTLVKLSGGSWAVLTEAECVDQGSVKRTLRDGWGRQCCHRLTKASRLAQRLTPGKSSPVSRQPSWQEHKAASLPRVQVHLRPGGQVTPAQTLVRSVSGEAGACTLLKLSCLPSARILSSGTSNAWGDSELSAPGSV